MKRKRVAVCEKDTGYLKRLTDYIADREREQLEVFGFSKEEDYLNTEQRQEFDILLFGETFFEKSKKYREKEHVILLSEGGVLPEEVPMLFKYQSAENLLRGIHYCLGSVMADPGKRSIFSAKKKVISVFSPCGHRLQTPFALAAAEELAGRKNVLYLNFSVCKGFCQNTGLQKGMDMGDLFYLMRESEEEFLAKLSGGIYSLGSFSVIPPPENPEHYMEWTGEEMETLITCLLEKSKYEALILDIGCIIPDFFRILERSSRLWLLKDQRNRRDAGLEELLALLAKRSPGLEKRAEEIFLPGGQGWQEDRYQVEEFYMGELGRCARRLLGEEAGYGDGIAVQTDSGRAGSWGGER